MEALETLTGIARPLPHPASSSRRLAIVEIAGRDSVAAGIVATRERGFEALLPTVAHTGTQAGDERAPLRAVELLRRRVRSQAEVLDPVSLGDTAMWSALNARFASEIHRLFGMHSPCLACHLYLHLCRVPLSWRLGRVPVVAGERDTHGGRLKLSQTPLAIDVAIDVLSDAGVELVEPIRAVESGDEIARIVGDEWDPAAGQLGCVLSGNYVALDGCVIFDEDAYARYAEEFLRPAGRAIVRAWRDLGWDDLGRDESAPERRPDYEAIVRDVLEGVT
ncbi:MAG: hypothetical protein IBX62_04910 [Coriobacteriia bacterium]|nr:hypothetical protein [Coriobacteriia bacterium]